VTLTRGLVVLAVSAALRPPRERIPGAWSAVLVWGGLRGGLPMVLVLSLAPSFPHRDLLVSMTFGVVIISILVHGLTMSPLLRKLGVVGALKERANYEFTMGKLQAADAALAELEQMSSTRHTSHGVIETLNKEYAARIEEDEQRVRELHLKHDAIREEELLATRRHLLHVEKDRIISAFHRGAFSRDVYDRLLADVDARLLKLENRETDNPEDST